jgi:hypothetical protein
MRDSIRGRLAFLRTLSDQPLVRILLAIWSLSGIWDLVLSEWIPEEYAKRLPKVYQAIAITLGIASWGIWVVFGLVIAGLASIEYAFRKTRVPATVVTVRPQSIPTSTRSADSGARRYMTAYETLHYLADYSAWGNETRQHVSLQQTAVAGVVPMRKMPLFEALGEFQRLAQQGKIISFGRLNGVGQHVEIPASYWLSATLSMASLDRPTVSEAVPAVPTTGIPTYTDVRIVREDVERAWPPALKGLRKWLHRIRG